MALPVAPRHRLRAVGVAAGVGGPRPAARISTSGPRSSSAASSVCSRRSSACSGRACRRRATSSPSAQMLMGALLIHLTGGRIETHFHVFGSLAFLAFYRDWRVLVPATVVVALDHLLRGIFWPQSVYGVAGREPVALAGARGLGALRGRLPRGRLPPQLRGDAADGRAHRRARAGGPHAAGGGERRATTPGARNDAHSRRGARLRRF